MQGEVWTQLAVTQRSSQLCDLLCDSLQMRPRVLCCFSGLGCWRGAGALQSPWCVSGGCPNPPTLGGRAELAPGQCLCSKGAVAVFWKHCLEISPVQLFKQKEQSCRAQNTPLRSNRIPHTLQTPHTLQRAQAALLSSSELQRLHFWMLHPINIPNLLGRRWMKVEESPMALRRPPWRAATPVRCSQPSVPAVFTNQGTAVVTHFGEFHWEPRLFLQDMNVQGAAEPLGSLLSARGAGDVTK